jgi:thiol-disulfide isomerase/thioredoxin
LCASSAFAQITIQGTVTNANGHAPILAHAHIGAYNADFKESKSYQCSKDGHYVFQVPSAGIYSLRVSAVDHEEVNIPLLLEKEDKQVTINIRLHADLFETNPDKITVIGDWNKFAFASSEQMTQHHSPDGKTIYTYERTATGDTLSYQLLGIAGGNSVNGTMADYFSYDGGGDYRSVIRTHKGDKVTITFDPSKLAYADNSNLPEVVIENNRFLKEAYTLTTQVEKMRGEALVTPPGGGAMTMQPEKYQAILDHIKQVASDAATARDFKFAQFAAVTLAKEYDPPFKFDASDADRILRMVPATSPMLVIAPQEMMAMTTLVDKGLAATYKENMRTNPERTVRAIAYADEMEHAVAVKDIKEWKRLYTILKTDYANVPEIKWTVIENNPDAVLQVGKQLPSFEVTLLDGSTKVNNTSMLGKYYMIDFWATWCGPCVHEMPAIHKAYEKFKGKKGFEILSLSMDASERQIAPFQQKKWKMPWLNAFIPGVFEADLAKKFEVVGIPKPILVGPDGKIVAMQEDLRGENLEKTLEKYLGEVN